ncbi:multidrug effflux MFS transporter [Hyphobacterium marinum]|uniref:Bcr/CflA family efflux transporter n=1 Tax=Hyphobacterium marinum TaxID=3116574 RepID=A0ABU7LX51_9PROT|nr:multidrug effflux MFS transporter [Hyphobacterium sp. Y6023]MEE2566137.1 multidrug effflux MFS transporter [Hyphobacterium sp. Y6023]
MSPPSPVRLKDAMSKWELIGILVVMTALVALSIDMMLPALPDIAESLNPAEENHRQLVVTAFLIGFGVAQLLYGPLADRFGRKPVILGALAFYGVATLVCLVAASFETLLLARFFQGAAAAACRVIATAIARDLTSGRRMAEVMSMAMTVFMIVPIIAPALGQLILMIAPWRWIFVALLLFAAGLALWLIFRLPETLHPEYRRPLRPLAILASYREATGDRLLLGYTLAGAAFFGGLYGFLNTAEQIFAEHYGLGDAFPIAFAAVAGAMSVTSYVNSRLVGRLGQRRLSHGALFAFTAISSLHAIVIAAGVDSLPLFIVMLAAAMMLLGLIAANFSALAMENVGHIAGTASAAYGFASGVIGAIIGAGIGQLYADSALPLVAGQAVMGLVTIGLVVLTEGGRLFGVGDEASAE